MPVYLRDIARADLPRIMRWRQTPAISQWLGEAHCFVSPESTELWFQNYQAQRHIHTRLAICKTSNDNHIGNLYLLHLHPVHRTVELHVMIGEIHEQGQGYGAQAVQLALTHAFNNLNINRIELKFLSHNKRALRLYQHCGFVQEGTLRQAAFKEGQYCDMIAMALLRTDWLKTTTNQA